MWVFKSFYPPHSISGQVRNRESINELYQDPLYGKSILAHTYQEKAQTIGDSVTIVVGGRKYKLHIDQTKGLGR